MAGAAAAAAAVAGGAAATAGHGHSQADNDDLAGLRSRVAGLQSARLALEALGRQLHEDRARESQDRTRLRELAKANQVLERRVAALMREKEQGRRERERVGAIAQVVEQLQAAASAQQQRLVEARTELARLEGVEAMAAQAERELALLRAEHEGLLAGAQAQSKVLAACGEHAQAFAAALARLLPAKEAAAREAEVAALLDTFFPLDQSKEVVWASLRGIVEAVGRLLGEHWQSQAQAAASAEREADGEVERERLLARAEDAEARLARLSGDWEEARAAARALEPLVQTLRDNLQRAEADATELREGLEERDRFVALVLSRLRDMETGLTGAGGGVGVGGGGGGGEEEEDEGAVAAAAAAAATTTTAPSDFGGVRSALALTLASVEEHVRCLAEHTGCAAGESERREQELQRLAQDFEGLATEHREMAADRKRQEEERERLERRLAGMAEETAALRKALNESRTALEDERARSRQWQRYAQRSQQEALDVQRSLQQVGAPAHALAGRGVQDPLLGERLGASSRF